ncbi:MAG: hypothetical protein GY719_24065 [bacterium]|nr:hypothetical protein [bacterium]
MVALGALWMPILVATVLVFIVSMLIWMVLNLHKKDWVKLPDEDAFAEAVNAQNPAVGEYSFPHAASSEEWKSDEWQAKFKRGPVGFLTIKPAGEMGMGKSMTAWLIYIVVIHIFVAYLCGQVLPAGVDYLKVFQVAGTAAILGFAGAVAPEAIWMGRRWSNVLRGIVDGVIYGLLTAGTFGWLWPAAG